MRSIPLLMLLVLFVGSAYAVDTQDDRISGVEQKYSDFVATYDKLPFWRKINYIMPKFRMKLIIKKIEELHYQKLHARTLESAEILGEEIEKLFHEFNLIYSYATDQSQKSRKK